MCWKQEAEALNAYDKYFAVGIVLWRKCSMLAKSD